MPSGNRKNRGSGRPPARPESVTGARALFTRFTAYTIWPGVPGAPVTANTFPVGRSPKSDVMLVKEKDAADRTCDTHKRRAFTAELRDRLREPGFGYGCRTDHGARRSDVEGAFASEMIDGVSTPAEILSRRGQEVRDPHAVEFLRDGAAEIDEFQTRIAIVGIHEQALHVADADAGHGHARSGWIDAKDLAEVVGRVLRVLHGRLLQRRRCRLSQTTPSHHPASPSRRRYDRRCGPAARRSAERLTALSR